MHASPKSISEGPHGDSSSWNGRILILAGLAVLVIVLLLLGWGLSAMQWTILTTNNNVSDALATHRLTVLAGPYSVPLGVERSYTLVLSFQASQATLSCGTYLNYPTCSLPMPISSSPTTIDDYVIFSIVLNSNGSAATVWYAGPHGNLTQPVRLFSTASSTFFKALVPGNYSLFILPVRCVPPEACQTNATNATGSFTLAVGTLTYNRPYYTSGLATVLVAGPSLLLAAAFLTVTANRIVKKRRTYAL
jgi:hypothetical protein